MGDASIGMGHPDYGPIRKRSISISGHRTSVSLENAFWRSLHAIAKRKKTPLAMLVADVAARCGRCGVSSALRQFILYELQQASVAGEVEIAVRGETQGKRSTLIMKTQDAMAPARP